MRHRSGRATSLKSKSTFASISVRFSQILRDYGDTPFTELVFGAFSSLQPVLIPFPRIARKAGTLLLQNGGVIRSLTNWGPFLLTKAVRKHQQKHDSGHHFILRFDASPEVQAKVRKAIAIDPRMIRCGVVKMVGGDKLVGEHGIRSMSEIGADGPPWRKGDKGPGGGILGGR
ncbi:MAG: hypothetical protein L6R39_001585 [Caloplaca ligustica]|nr:MAG: hypothetical protein L6R39_001585 [Caloplaca ligustica]